MVWSSINTGGVILTSQFLLYTITLFRCVEINTKFYLLLSGTENFIDSHLNN